MKKNEAVEKLVTWLKGEVGYKATSDKRNKYAEELDKTHWFNGRKNGYDWCAVFADYAFYHLFGYDTAKKMVYQPDYSLGAGCLYAARYYEQANALYKAPEKGDQIFFGAGGDDHTGIVIEVRQGRVYTVEGNSGNAVKENDYALTDRWIYAYGRPNWSAVTEIDLVPASFEADPDRVWKYLVEWLGNEYGSAGLMGNLEAESGLIAGNLQNSYERSLGMTDEEYTDAVDDETYTNFANDHAGYGLAQWTYSTRKEKLLRHNRSVGASVGNLDAQLDYLRLEIEAEFPSVWSRLKKAENVGEASDAVLLDFERPADQSEANLQRRRERGQKIYNQYHGDEPKPQPQGECEVKARILGIGDEGNDVKTLQGALQAHGYDLRSWGGADGIFGTGTESMVKKYQRDHNLVVDGEVGKETWGELLST